MYDTTLSSETDEQLLHINDEQSDVLFDAANEWRDSHEITAGMGLLPRQEGTR